MRKEPNFFQHKKVIKIDQNSDNFNKNKDDEDIELGDCGFIFL